MPLQDLFSAIDNFDMRQISTVLQEDRIDINAVHPEFKMRAIDVELSPYK